MNASLPRAGIPTAEATVELGSSITPVDTSTPWDDLVRNHASRVYGLAYGLTGNRHDAEDLTQDVFIRVFRNLASYRPGNFDGWLYRIVSNAFRDQIRRNRHRRPAPLRAQDVDRYPICQPGPDQLTEPVFDDDVRDALASLHPDFRIAVLLYDVDGLTYDEIAAALGVKLGTISSRIHRGRAQLRTALAHRRPRTHDPAAASSTVAAA